MSFSNLLQRDFAEQFASDTDVYSNLNSVLFPVGLEPPVQMIRLSEAGIELSRRLASKEAAEAERLLQQLEAGMSDSDLSSLRLAGKVNE